MIIVDAAMWGAKVLGGSCRQASSLEVGVMRFDLTSVCDSYGYQVMNQLGFSRVSVAGIVGCALVDRCALSASVLSLAAAALDGAGSVAMYASAEYLGSQVGGLDASLGLSGGCLVVAFLGTRKVASWMGSLGDRICPTESLTSRLILKARSQL